MFRWVKLRKRKALTLAWITSDVAVSAAPSEEDWPDLRGGGFGAVVELRDEAQDDTDLLRRLGFEYVRFPVAEGLAPDASELAKMSEWVATRLSNSSRVLIHCSQGRGRSPLLACATLIRLGFTLKDSYEMIKRSQPLVELSLEQSNALAAFARSQGRARPEE